MIQRRRSKIAGWGVYATRPINKNTRIVTYDGEKITHKESRRREAKYLDRVIDAHVGGNVARYINHSCKPNCYSWVKDGVIWIRAARNIRKGEELSYDYNTTGNAEIPCRCRPGCKNSI
jgi:uncharacterized protein